MKKIIITIIALFISCTFFNNIGYANGEQIYKDFSSSTAEIVMERDSKRVLFEQNSHEKKYMASTTKILTTLVIIENCDLNKQITVTKDTVGIEGSSIYLEEGEKLTYKELLYGLMLRSGNDCAETLAVNCSGSIKEFANLMNKTAKRLGAENSNFVNPHGLPNDNHYTTAYDLALISCYAMQNQTFREIVGTKSILIPFTTRNTNRLLKNKNKMLNEYENASGIKTGYTKKAGRCLVSSAIKNGMELISVVLNCQPMFEKSKELLDYGFNNYKQYNLVESDNIIDFIDYKDKKIPIHIKNDLTLPLSDKEYKNIKIKYIYNKSIDNLTKKDTLIGFVQIYAQNNLIFEQKIYTMIDINN